MVCRLLSHILSLFGTCLYPVTCGALGARSCHYSYDVFNVLLYKSKLSELRKPKISKEVICEMGR
jgi:hypothetical protein